MRHPRVSPWTVLGLSGLAAATLVGCSWLRSLLGPGPATRVILALVPVIPVSVMGWAMVAAIRGLDELQRRIVLEAIFGAFLAGAFLTLVYGQLQQARVGLPELNWALIWGAMAAPCAAAFFFSSRRYQ
jgi:hypothetical protein